MSDILQLPKVEHSRPLTQDVDDFSVESSLDEARLQLEKTRNSRRARMARSVMKMLTGNKDFMTKREATLHDTATELQDRLAPREAELDQACAMNDIYDEHSEQVRLHSDEEESRARVRKLEQDEALYAAAGSLTDMDPATLTLRREQEDAHATSINERKADSFKRESAAASAYEVAEQAQWIDEHSNPRPMRQR